MRLILTYDIESDQQIVFHHASVLCGHFLIINHIIWWEYMISNKNLKTIICPFTAKCQYNRITTCSLVLHCRFIVMWPHQWNISVSWPASWLESQLHSSCGHLHKRRNSEEFHSRFNHFTTWVKVTSDLIISSDNGLISINVLLNFYLSDGFHFAYENE